jgi:hypothetical protein
VLGGCRIGLLDGVLGWSVDPGGVGQIQDLRRALSTANPKCTSAGVCSPMPVLMVVPVGEGVHELPGRAEAASTRGDRNLSPLRRCQVLTPAALPASR